GLLFSDIETGGSASYVRQGAARVDLTLITLASASAAHSDGGFIEVDATNMPGIYRCDFPDAAWATGIDQVICSLVAAAGNNAVIAPILIDISEVPGLIAAVPTEVWQDTLTTYTDGMAGKRLKSITAIPTLEAEINDVSATTTSFETTLTGYGDAFFNDTLIVVEIAPEQWQGRTVAEYVSATGAFTLDEALVSAPADGANIAVKATHIHTVTEIAASVAAYDMGDGRTIEEALAFLRNKWEIVAGVLTVYDTDDTTVLWTSAVVQTAGDPVSSSDPG
ncbi:MAG: hypothetical protein KAT90_14075, partial [Gammaproteobacteria bacterium]|nr:hypothetical protein [Gammaproteobacteria bacterium]